MPHSARNAQLIGYPRVSAPTARMSPGCHRPFHSLRMAVAHYPCWWIPMWVVVVGGRVPRTPVAGHPGTAVSGRPPESAQKRGAFHRVPLPHFTRTAPAVPNLAHHDQTQRGHPVTAAGGVAHRVDHQSRPRRIRTTRRSRIGAEPVRLDDAPGPAPLADQCYGPQGWGQSCVIACLTWPDRCGWTS